MTCGSRAAFALILVLAAANTLSSAQASDASSAIRLVAVTYADGRTTTMPLRHGTWDTWTPVFPRIPGASTIDHGLALDAVQFDYAMDGRDLLVTVSLLYGTPHQKRVSVAEVRVVDEHPVRVNELKAFGVQPIAFAMPDYTKNMFTRRGSESTSAHQLTASLQSLPAPTPLSLIRAV